MKKAETKRGGRAVAGRRGAAPKRASTPALAEFLDDPEYPNHGSAIEGLTRLEAARREYRALLAVARAARRFDRTRRQEINDPCKCGFAHCEECSITRALARLARASRPGGRP